MQVNVAFNSIGFHAAQIINRLRNERLVTEVNREDEESRRKQEAEDEAVRAKLTFVKRRVADIAEFEDRASGNNRAARKRR